MPPDEARFNHVGICVTDLDRSRHFYENALDFKFWWELDTVGIPEAATSQLLQLDQPVGLQAVYLVRDGFVLELLAYNPDRYEPARGRSMAEPGLTHISLAVDDVNAAISRVEKHGGTAIPETNIGAAMVRDPDGQLIELVGSAWRDARPPLPG
jgi:catechol 2,3-dioxygenase-like lactoylglutathione lyase family enzyme